jgi:lipoate-protein ligase A
MPLYVSDSRDPFFHLAVEEWLLREAPLGDEPLWFLYRNDPCVVVGRFQNPWKEADLGWMASEGIPLVRRPSGGGTVWHDPGNVNFCCVRPLKGFNKALALEEVQSRLEGFGREVMINERFDLRFQGSKVSGSAYKQTKDRALHHGTLLLQGDLERLERSLTSPARLTSTKSIASVRSPVLNLDIAPEVWIESWGDAETLGPADCRFDRGPWFRWEWVFGETPHFEWDFKVGEHEIGLSCHKGIIQRLDWHRLREHHESLGSPLRAETFYNLASAQGVSISQADWRKVLG